jgi:SAM-dependent methyltransferase
MLHDVCTTLPPTPRYGLLNEMKKKRRGKGANFWDAEYREGGHLALSTNVSEDLEKFTRFLEREQGRALLNVTTSVADLGCGNGRNLIWLSKTYGMRGWGCDISGSAISQAKARAKEANLPLQFETRSIAPPIPLPDASQHLILDMMSSHFLNAAERAELIEECYRILKPGGFLFYKTFLLDEDRHAYRMLKENPCEEENTYIHPEIGVPEHVSTEEEIDETYGRRFHIHKVHKSHRHRGENAKRRSIMIYAEKPAY